MFKDPATGEKIDGTPKEVISAIMAKLNTAEKEINYLKVKIQNMCGLDNLPCTEHNDFKLNDDYFHCMVCTQLMIKVIRKPIWNYYSLTLIVVMMLI